MINTFFIFKVRLQITTLFRFTHKSYHGGWKEVRVKHNSR